MSSSLPANLSQSNGSQLDDRELRNFHRRVRHQFMEKQIWGVAESERDECFGLNSSDEQNGTSKGEIFPDYGAQPICPIVSDNGNSGARVWSSAESSPSSYPSLETREPIKAPQEQDKETYKGVLMEEIDKTMKKYVDNILRAIEDLSARLTRMESRTCHLEVSIDELNVSLGNHHGSTEGKLRELENILREVDAGGRQEITEARSQLTKLQLLKAEPQSPESAQVEALPSQAFGLPLPQIVQAPSPPLPLPILPPPPPNALPPPDAPPTTPPQQLPTPQLPPSQPSFYSPPPPPSHQVELPRPQYHIPSQPQEAPPMPYQLPPPPQSAQPPQHYEMTPQMIQKPPPSVISPLPLYPPLPQQNQPIPPLVNPPPHCPEEQVPYMPSPQPYPPRQHGIMSPSANPLLPSSPPFYGHSQMPPPSRTGSAQMTYPTGYGPHFNDPYAYTGSPSPYNGPPANSSQLFPPAQASSYPSALSHTLPSPTSSVRSNPNSTVGNPVLVDDVVERVAAMGFSRDQVYATVRRLIENGHSVDMHVVLDKMMNGGEGQSSQRGWYSR